MWVVIFLPLMNLVDVLVFLTAEPELGAGPVVKLLNDEKPRLPALPKNPKGDDRLRSRVPNGDPSVFCLELCLCNPLRPPPPFRTKMPDCNCNIIVIMISF